MCHKKYPTVSVAFLKVVLVVIILITGLLVYGFIHYQNQSVDLLQKESWQQFPGATIVKNGVHFQPLNRIIIHQDGSVGQPNPPVNIAGQHLLVNGDFKITATLVQIDKQASLRFYASPPLVYDQWRYESPSLEIVVDTANHVIIARIWDGFSNSSMDIRSYKIYPQNKIIISLEHSKNKINIIENNHWLGDMPDHNIFSGGNIWLGADGLFGSNGWTLASLRARPMKMGSIKIISAPLMDVDQSNLDSLHNLADAGFHKIKIGTAVALEPLFSDEYYRNLVLGQFNIVTPENLMKPEFIHPAPSVYDFSGADQLVNIARKNNIAVHGHVLVYAKSSPEWMTKSNIENRQQIMISHITTVAEHFKEKVTEWDVVNEPLSNKNTLYQNDGSGLDNNIWFEAMGENYIDTAFITAHKADPKAKLYLNEYGIENDGQRWDAMLRLIKRLQKRGVPIDGIGFEAHVYGDGQYINATQLKNHLEVLAKLGLLARISEIDVTEDDAKEQINQYVAVLDACLFAPNCTSYTIWGITDGYGSTTRSDRYPLVYGTSLLWDKEMKAKSAYSAILERLRQDY